MKDYSERTDSRRKPKRPRLQLNKRRRRDDERFHYEPNPDYFIRPPVYLN